MKKIVLGITGASGAPYAKRILDALVLARAKGEMEIAACLSETAPEVWALEVGGDVREALAAIDVPCFGLRDYKAPFASGSAGWNAMIIAPSSMSTCARIAHGISDTLLTRAADVMIKEKRALVIVPRETPLSIIHLENLTALARAGATIVPATPSFYGKPETLSDAIDTVVARVLDHAGVAHAIGKRWGEKKDA